jgi:acetolactate synthase-1/2/3 large subunit
MDGEIKRPETIPEIVRKAFKLAELEKPEAVHIELPEDIAGDEIDPNIVPTTVLPKSVPAMESLEKAVERIKQSENRLLLPETV